MRTIVALLAVLALTSAPAPAALQQWESQRSGTGARLRGLSVVSDQIAWVSGSGGTVLRTVDGGRVWQPLTVSEDATLDFRDIDAMSATTAYALSIGNGPLSRIYKTTDGGQTWTLQFQNDEPRGFLDAMAFWDETRGIAFGDSIDGQFFILRTVDGGATWERVPPASLPPALDGEGAFAASGTNVAVQDTSHVWIATGAAARSRVLHSSDAGKTWTIAETPLASGGAAGAFSIAFRDTRHGVVVGGDYAKEDIAIDNAAFTNDGGKTWRAATGLSGYRSVVVHLPNTRAGGSAWLALGPSGADISTDDGKTWTQMASIGFDTAGAVPGEDNDRPVVFASGANGRLGRLVYPPRQ